MHRREKEVCSKQPLYGGHCSTGQENKQYALFIELKLNCSLNVVPCSCPVIEKPLKMKLLTGYLAVLSILKGIIMYLSQVSLFTSFTSPKFGKLVQKILDSDHNTMKSMEIFPSTSASYGSGL